MRREGTVATQNKTETGLVAGVWLDLTITLLSSLVNHIVTSASR